MICNDLAEKSENPLAADYLYRQSCKGWALLEI